MCDVLSDITFLANFKCLIFIYFYENDDHTFQSFHDFLGSNKSQEVLVDYMGGMNMLDTWQEELRRANDDYRSGRMGR